MPFREVQSLYRSETLRKLQSLVQLGNVPFVRFSMSALIRHQFWLMAIVFGVTLIVTIRHPASWLMIKRQVAIEFFSAVAQSLAALLGVLIVFLTVTSQLISQKRLDYYHALQTQIEQLIGLTLTLPTELEELDELLVETINYLAPLKMKDFPIWSSAASADEAVMLETLLHKFKAEWIESQQRVPLNTRLYLQQILLLLNNMEEILEGFLMLYNHTLEIGRFVLAIARLSFLLGLSLLFLLLFGIVELQNKLPDLSLPTMVTSAVWVLIALLELVCDTWFL